jgi:hypothetical protein
MNLRCEARVQMEQPRTDQLQRRNMIVARERMGTARVTYQSSGLKCNRPRQAPTDATSQVETAIDAIGSVRAKYGPVPAALVSGELSTERREEGRFGYPVMRKPLDPATIRSLLREFRQSGSGFEGITP